MTVLSGELLPFSFRSCYEICVIWLCFMAILKPIKHNTFLKRVTKEMMIINMKLEDKDVPVHFLYSWLELQYVCSSSHQLKSFSPFKLPFSSPTYHELLRPKRALHSHVYLWLHPAVFSLGRFIIHYTNTKASQTPALCFTVHMISGINWNTF